MAVSQGMVIDEWIALAQNEDLRSSAYTMCLSKSCQICYGFIS